MIQERADEAGLKISEFLRQGAVKTTIKKSNKDLFGVINAVNRIGNNINQIAKKINQNFYDDNDDKGDELLNELKLIKADLREILKKCEE